MMSPTISNPTVGFFDMGVSAYVKVGVSFFNETVKAVDEPRRATSNSSDFTNISITEGDISSNGWYLTVYSYEHLVTTSVILGLFVLCCIIGNCFVIAAVMLERSLHNVANYLILSLAVADLLVAVLVMPLSVVSEISQVSSFINNLLQLHFNPPRAVIFILYRQAKRYKAWRILR